MSYSLKLLKGKYIGVYIGTTIGVTKGDARSLDYSSYVFRGGHRPGSEPIESPTSLAPKPESLSVQGESCRGMKDSG